MMSATCCAGPGTAATPLSQTAIAVAAAIANIRARGAKWAAGTVNRAADERDDRNREEGNRRMPFVLTDEARLEGDVQDQRVRHADHRETTAVASLQHDRQCHGERGSTEERSAASGVSDHSDIAGVYPAATESPLTT